MTIKHDSNNLDTFVLETEGFFFYIPLKLFDFFFILLRERNTG